MFNVVNPLVVNLGVSEFVDAFDVVGGSLINLFLVKETCSRVVCELAEEMLCFVGGARGFVARVGV